jgi:hypothetical protein
LLRKSYKEFGENGEAVKQSYHTGPLFIGEEGVVSRSCLEMTVARFEGDECPLRHFDCDIFTEILIIVRGNGSSESTRFPEGLVLGNWVKTLHPRNFGVTETLANS